jgi:hypothetical protein
MSKFVVLSADAIVYRSLLRKQWINEDTGRVTADAYFLRPNEPGLSVNLADACTPEECARFFRKCYGVASLEVGDVPTPRKFASGFTINSCKLVFVRSSRLGSPH